ncbi:hypothetical protein BGY98DRAFT_1176260 [Russula aff. rugulosa BPL654]|nr:hypothetical protein BGY98DRAFT_1176260 [Russula aff. rugulosa BPL654]
MPVLPANRGDKERERQSGVNREAQKRDADGVLVFNGLFSAVVAVFIVESYKKLSPDSGITTTSLLSQISQQVTGFQNNTYPRPQETAPFSLAILFVNALWFIILGIAIVSAFYVMLVQQWIRRYTQTLAESTDDKRVRLPIFHPNVGRMVHHTMFSVAASGCHLVVEQFRSYSGSDEEVGPGKLSDLSEYLRNTIKKAPFDMDLVMLTWSLQRPIMGDKGEFQAFIDSIPPQILVRLSTPEAYCRKKSIRDRLFNLFQDRLDNKDDSRNRSSFSTSRYV